MIHLARYKAVTEQVGLGTGSLLDDYWIGLASNQRLALPQVGA